MKQTDEFRALNRREQRDALDVLSIVVAYILAAMGVVAAWHWLPILWKHYGH